MMSRAGEDDDNDNDEDDDDNGTYCTTLMDSRRVVVPFNPSNAEATFVQRTRMKSFLKTI